MTTQKSEGFIQETKHTMITAMTPGISGSADVNTINWYFKDQLQDFINIKKKCTLIWKESETVKTIHKPFFIEEQIYTKVLHSVS